MWAPFIEQYTINVPPKYKKPPLGLTPKWILDEHRLQEIHEAIMRYKRAHKEIPSEWIQEYISLCNV